MDEIRSSSISMTVQALQRLPFYLQYLKKLNKEGVDIVSATETAESLKLNEVLVRKDFGIVSTNRGKPKVGFKVFDLINDIEEVLGYHNNTDVALVGVGSLGKALFSYGGFDECGLRITLGFDKDESIIGSEINGKEILHIDKIPQMCKKMKIRIGIIAVPLEEAQDVCDRLVEGGILAIWNFTPIKLSVPDNVIVKNENIVTSLTVLAKQLKERQESE